MSDFRGVPFALPWVVLAVSPAIEAASTRPVGTLIAVQGTVAVNRMPIKPPRALLEGEEISTSGGASCTVILGRDAVIHLGEKSIFRLTRVEIENRKASVRLDQGKMRALLKTQTLRGRARDIEEFTVRSRSATLGVRGTQFVLESPADAREPERFVGIEGTVVVRLEGQRATDPTSTSESREVRLERGQAVGSEGGAKVQSLAENQFRQESRACVAPPLVVNTPAQFQATEVLLAGVVDSVGSSDGMDASSGFMATNSGSSLGGVPSPGLISFDPVADSPVSGVGGDDGTDSSGGNGTVLIQVGSGKQDRVR
jgi:hypothetical protein